MGKRLFFNDMRTFSIDDPNYLEASASNVTGDIAATTIISRSEKMIDLKKFNS